MSVKHCLLAGLVLATACADHPEAKVSGMLRLTGGPSGASPTGVRGEITFVRNGSRRVTAAHADGTFAMSLAPGSYQVTGTSPQFGSGQNTCMTEGPVIVGTSGAANVVVTCSRK